MEGILLAILLGWAGGYRFYKKQYLLGVIYLLSCGLCGVGWIIDIFCSISNSQKMDRQNQTMRNYSTGNNLRTYRVKQSDLLSGFEKVNVSTSYEPIQEGIKTLRLPNPNNTEHPYIIDIKNKDVIFKEMEYRNEGGLECFQIYISNHHIGTLFDSGDNLNRMYIQALIQGKVDAVHIEIDPQPKYNGQNLDFDYKTNMWMHISREG